MHRKRTLEEIAMAEVGHTDFSRGVSSFLVVLFLIIVVAVPAATLWRKHLAPDAATTDASPDLSIGRQFRTLVAAPDLRAALLALRLANAEILHGIKVYEDNTKESSLWVRHIIPHLRVAMAYVGAGNENAYIGRGDWLYYRLDVDYVAGPPFLDPRILARRTKTASEWERSPQPDPVAGILHFRDQLMSRGIALVVVPIPTKAGIESSAMRRRAEPVDHPLQNPSFPDFVLRLSQAGVNVFDPSCDLFDLSRKGRVAAYLKGDTHWTPEAMDLTAETLADFIRTRVGLPEGIPTVFRETTTPVTNRGDIRTMLRLPKACDLFPPQTVLLRQVLQPDGASWRPSPDANILLLGDSFADIYSGAHLNWGTGAGLSERLSFHLQRPLDTLLRDAGGSYATRDAIAREGAAGHDRLAGKRLVIWQFAARDLAQGDWRRIILPAPTKAMALKAPDSSGEFVRANIQEVSIQPDPNAPYEDALRAFRMQVGNDEFIGMARAMSSRRLLPAATWRVGQSCRLRRTPWSEAIARDPALESIPTINDIENMNLVIWFVEEIP